MFSNKFLWIIFFVALVSFKEENIGVRCQILFNTTIRTILNGVGKVSDLLLMKCIPHNWKTSKDTLWVELQGCMRRRSLLALDRAMRLNVIEIADGVTLVKVQTNETDNPRVSKELNVSSLRGMDFNWQDEVVKRLKDVFRTRVVRLKLGKLTGTLSEARHRRKANMMTQLFMFGLIAAGLIVIPMGFQFLAVLGGKALLLAKLALLLTSIQGLKKIATSHVNYGLYSTGGPTPWHYDRQWPYDTDPYQSQSFFAPEEPHTDILHTGEQNIYPRKDMISNNY